MFNRYIFKESKVRKLNFRKGRGFTLIELLVVIAIIGILAGMILVAMGGTRSKARDAKRISDMRQLMSAQELYHGYADAYYTSENMPASIDYAGKTLLVSPNDPGGGDLVHCGELEPAFTYCTIDNRSEPQKFCYFARLQEGITNKVSCTSGTPCYYITVNQVGTFYRADKPDDLDDCPVGSQ